MTDSFERIEEYFERFRSKVTHCRNEAMSNMADIQDAYDRFYRLRERYLYEAKARTLSPTEEAPLRKVFRDNKFIESVGKVRGIGEHVETGDIELLDPDNARFTLTAKSSAAAMFAARCVRLTDKQGQIQHLNHLKWLTHAVHYIARAMAKAKGN